MGQKRVNEFSAKSIDLLGSTFNSTSLDFVVSLGLFDATSTTINYVKNTMYFENNIITGIGTAVSTSITST